ncbi:MAG: HAMP domain-containing histidine kinase [Clostridiales bacterium]|nr:HAMP domain-containing histidine kinase [Clostridiales bacterium]
MSENSNIEIDEKVEANEKKSKSKKKIKNKSGMQGFLQFLQHVLITVAAVVLLSVISGSTIVVHDLYGNSRYTYSLWNVGNNGIYEESDIFNSTYKNAVSDIMRFCVIRSQMETDGKFDGNKIIDVTAYVNRTSAMPESYLTARYYLKDLLKWQNYGLEYSTYASNSKELNNFLSPITIITTLNRDIPQDYPTDYYYMKVPTDAYKIDVSGNSLIYGGSGGYDGAISSYSSYSGYDNTTETVTVEEMLEETPDQYYDILFNRYKTIEGKNIEDYTSEWGSYLRLCDNIATAMEDLKYNYDEYLQFSDYYAGNNTNIRYCLERTVNGYTEYFTNMIDDSIDGTTEENRIDKAAFFDDVFAGKMNDNMSRYIYYDPDIMLYETNSNIDEEWVRQILKKYSYAYPENIRLWIAVDNYVANDAFAEGYNGFQNYAPNIFKWLVLAASAIILYLIIFIRLTVTTGRHVDENGNVSIALTGFDKIPTEAALVLGVVSGVLIVAAFVMSLDVVYFDDLYTTWFRIGFGAIVFVADIVLLFFYYSLVRRIKAKTLWKNSFINRIVRKCVDVVSELYANSNIAVRTCVPYILFLIFNIFMMIMFQFVLGSYHLFGLLLVICITLAVDVVVGMILYRDVKERQDIVNIIEKTANGDFSHQVEPEKVHGHNITLAKSVNSIGNGIKTAVENSMKDERMKTELITNVSHDIKTPLTSIINYVDLIKREKIDNERVNGYIKILDEKSQRLKQLTDDLVEASKISSGNISLSFERINLTELLNQTVGEFSEKFEEKNLNIVMNISASNVVIEADSRRIWRIMENLFNNIYKYALEGTRVYITAEEIKNKDAAGKAWIEISLKNISATELNCNPEELTERFIRGDESRTTEGSGLGLSIAKNLTEALNGTFEIRLDGDLFKVIIAFPLIPAGNE